MQTELFPTAPAAPICVAPTPLPDPPYLSDLPIVALSIRQPWAWLIVHRFKPLENRIWRTKFRGRFLVHAAKGMTRGEYEDAVEFATEIDASIKVPPLKELERGGIVGVATVTDCVSESDSPWFTGPHAFALAEVLPLPFKPLNGSLGFFPANYHAERQSVTKPIRRYFD